MPIVVHGGAGDDPEDGRAARRAGVERAADAGAAVLERGGSALDAVAAAVVVLEDDPCFNAGLGSVLTEDGGVEMDASIMDGERLRAGAVAAVRGVPNPIHAAVRRRSPCVGALRRRPNRPRPIVVTPTASSVPATT